MTSFYLVPSHICSNSSRLTNIFAATRLTHICNNCYYTHICATHYNTYIFAATLVDTHIFVSPTHTFEAAVVHEEPNVAILCDKYINVYCPIYVVYVYICNNKLNKHAINIHM